MAELDENPVVKRAQERLAGLRDGRYGFWVHWRGVAEYVLPRRYRWLVTPNEAGQRGREINQKILDSTGTIAWRNLSAGMQAGITSPTRPWFKLRYNDGNVDDPTSETNKWLAECEKRMMRVFSESNFYTSIAVVYGDMGAFGTGVMYIAEDFDDVIRCHNFSAGEYYLAESARGAIDTVYREFTMTLAQIEEEFGGDMPSEMMELLKSNGGNTTKEYVIVHAVEPNKAPRGKVSASFKYRETYWIAGQGSASKAALRQKGYHEWPFAAARWDLSPGDVYGRSPAMDALGDIKQLQQETKRKAQAIDKMVTPPMLADIGLQNQPASLLPGGVTYVSSLDSGKGMRPVYSVMPPVRELMEDIKEIQERIRNIFFNDLFMMFQQLQAEPRSAAAIDARREEKMVMLGPVLERIENEVLDPIIDRVFGIMYRGRLLPPPPQEIAAKGGAFIRVEYVSMLAEAQKASSTSGFERLLQVAGGIVSVDPTVMDNINMDVGITDYASKLSVEPAVLSSPEERDAKRKARADQLAQQQAGATGTALAQGAKNLSQTDVGGGANALQAMLGTGP